ncbi:hypothetical protein BJF84_02615 [Rhodococcus sp. CUA-806]|nr:hypothetical protein BJF84_02615 [Rhodococcus sp. CUA-806]
MRRLKFLLRPQWLALAAVVALFAFLCFSVLAPWQLGKNTSTAERNELINQSTESEPVAIGELLTSTDPAAGEPSFAAQDEWRRVTATGTYLQDQEVLVRLRVVQQLPAYEVVTPFQLTDGPIVLVNRGYVLPEQGTAPPPFEAAPAGEVTLGAHLRQAEDGSRASIEEAGHVQVYNIDPEQIGSVVGVSAIDGYLQLESDQPGGLGVIALPQTDSGPYLGYGLQWLAFGIMAPLGLAYFVRAELRERRKAAGEPEDTAPEDVTPRNVAPEDVTLPQPTDSDPVAAEPEFTLPTRKQRKSKSKNTSVPRTANDVRLADRYGKKR